MQNKITIIILIVISIGMIKATSLAQISPEGSGSFGNTLNQQVTWNEHEVFTYYVNDATTIREVNDLDLVSMQPRKHEYTYKYVWDENGFNYYEKTQHGHLQNNAYFSFPDKTFRYEYEGIKDVALDGTITGFQISDTIMSLTTWQGLTLEQVSPIFPKPANFTFVPMLSNQNIADMLSSGFKVLVNTPDRLEIANSEFRSIIDGINNTRSTIYFESDGSILSIHTSYYSYDNDYIYKIKEVDQFYKTLVSGLCVLRVCENTYSDVVLGSNPLQPRIGKSSVKHEVKIFPNPSNGNFIIKPESDYHIDGLEVYDMSGNKVATKVGRNMNNSIQLSVINPIAGIYILKYTIAGVSYTERLQIY